MSKINYAEAVPVQAYAVNSNDPIELISSNPPPYASLTTSQECQPEEGYTREFLSDRSWPTGLQKFLLKNVTKIPFRFFICDDSGSMACNDGKRLVGSGNSTKVVNCSRWTEMTESLKFHAQLAQALNMPSEFRLLNSAAPIMIGGSSAAPHNLGILNALFDQSPGGGTPLCRHIREVTAEVRELEPSLRASGQKVVIIIMTDGEASDGDLAKAMKPLETLPVWVVIRLCTDEGNVVSYWNEIDEKLELEIDVIDDLLGEGEEAFKVNSWLNYAEPLHRMREFGVHLKEVNLLILFNVD